MLFKSETLNGIAKGEITCAFRRWKRPTVRKGGTLITAVGQLAIHQIKIVKESHITDQDAIWAGFETTELLMSTLRTKDHLPIYRIDFELIGPDPRIVLRNNSRPEINELEQLAERLKSMDSSPKVGAWTVQTLILIQKHPERRAGDLAKMIGVEKAIFKRDVRKLKNMGLTESLSVGYRISPRGKALLAYLLE